MNKVKNSDWYSFLSGRAARESFEIKKQVLNDLQKQRDEIFGDKTSWDEISEIDRIKLDIIELKITVLLQ